MPALPPVANTAMVQTRYICPTDNHLSYIRLHYKWDTGSAQGADMVALATNVHNQWKTLFATANFASGTQLEDSTAVDLTTSSGATGFFAAQQNGAGSGVVPNSVCGLINWQIARRFRGGKSKTFLSGLSSSAINDTVDISTTFQGNLTSVGTGFLSATGPILSATYPNISGLHMVTVSYFQGFTNYTKPNGREASRPTLRSVPVTDIIFKCNVPFKIATQRRRLLAG